MNDLFTQSKKDIDQSYSAKDIEVLEGLEPVRKRPGMYIGGTDDKALHHLVAEILDNAMDEAVAGHASKIEFIINADRSVTIRDNGRGIPVDPHPKFPDKSALEIILTTLHSGGKFSGKAYETSGGLHGVGLSVVNALSDRLTIEVARDRRLWTQDYSRGAPTTPLIDLGDVRNRRGTTITFHPDPKIFGDETKFSPKTLFQMATAKAYLYKNVEIQWQCDEGLVKDADDVPVAKAIHFPKGIVDFLTMKISNKETVMPHPFSGELSLPDNQGRLEWAVSWLANGSGFSLSYCNTIPTPLGGSHETGVRGAFLKSLKAYGEFLSLKKAQSITNDDIFDDTGMILSLFVKDPQFQGQTKEKLSMPGIPKQIESVLKDRFDLWLTEHPQDSKLLIEYLIEKAEARLQKKQDKALQRKSATQRLRLPGKLADCSRNTTKDTEIFLVEGDSAGGSAKQARDRETQAILPLRGKILNVASATIEKIRANQEIQDLVQALGCGIGDSYKEDDLRYDRVIIMTDADVDGAHIASLLMTFFYKQMNQLILDGHLYLALPPLYRMTAGNISVYARDDAHREKLLKTTFKGKKNIEVSRFKGLGEMPPKQLKETTMDPKNRILLRVYIDDEQDLINYENTDELVEALMGKKPELRFKFIQERAKFVDTSTLDLS